MNSKKMTVAILSGIALLAFLAVAYFYNRSVQTSQEEKATKQAERLVRMHSPVLGPQNAPVTIVEFFDPACETCAAFYPMVKQLIARDREDIRLVVRYAPLHQGSDEVVLTPVP